MTATIHRFPKKGWNFVTLGKVVPQGIDLTRNPATATALAKYAERQGETPQEAAIRLLQLFLGKERARDNG